MDRNIPKEVYQKIEARIASSESVVGIDAKNTHIIIIHMLEEIQQKLDDLDQRISKLEESN